MIDIARKAGVSRTVVSRVINGKKGFIPISTETERKVLKIAREFNYVPNAIARSLALKKTKNIAFIYTTTKHKLFSDPFYSEVLEGVEEEIKTQGYHLMLSTVESNFSGSINSFPLVRERKVDGAVLIGLWEKTFVQSPPSSEFPVVLIDPFRKVKSDSILIDNHHGAYTMVKYLLELGHLKIGFIYGKFENGLVPLSFEERLRGYKQALRDSGVKYGNKFVLLADLNKDGGRINAGYLSMQKLLKLPSRPTAVFAANDFLAIGALKFLHETGVHVPEEINIGGFDDIILANHVSPPLTTISVDKREMGRKAVGLLLKRIANQEKPVEYISVKTRLVVRNTTEEVIKK